jgi:hypothetical protein
MSPPRKEFSTAELISDLLAVLLGYLPQWNSYHLELFFMSGHVLFGVDLGEVDEERYYELEEQLAKHPLLELLPYFVGDECLVFLKGTKVDADYGSLVTELPKLEVSEDRIAAFKAACEEFELKGTEPAWVVTFVGNE